MNPKIELEALPTTKKIVSGVLVTSINVNDPNVTQWYERNKEAVSEILSSMKSNADLPGNTYEERVDNGMFLATMELCYAYTNKA